MIDISEPDQNSIEYISLFSFPVTFACINFWRVCDNSKNLRIPTNAKSIPSSQTIEHTYSFF